MRYNHLIGEGLSLIRSTLDSDLPVGVQSGACRDSNLRLYLIDLLKLRETWLK
jgi:hypothetical protein